MPARGSSWQSCHLSFLRKPECFILIFNHILTIRTNYVYRKIKVYRNMRALYKVFYYLSILLIMAYLLAFSFNNKCIWAMDLSLIAIWVIPCRFFQEVFSLQHCLCNCFIHNFFSSCLDLVHKYVRENKIRATQFIFIWWGLFNNYRILKKAHKSHTMSIFSTRAVFLSIQWLKKGGREF